MDPSPGSTLLPDEGFPLQDIRPRRSRRKVWLGIVVGVLALLLAVVVGLVMYMLRFQERQVALVEDALATLATGDPLPTSAVCADPDDVVSGLVDEPGSWPVTSYEVLGISDHSYSSTTAVSQWFVDAIVNDERWLVEVWDADAGRMAGLCGIAEPLGR